MEILIAGGIFTKLLISCLWELLLMEVYYVCMAAYLLIYQLSIKCVYWTENKKFLTKDLWQI